MLTPNPDLTTFPPLKAKIILNKLFLLLKEMVVNDEKH